MAESAPPPAAVNRNVRPSPCPFCGQKPKFMFFPEGTTGPEIEEAWYSLGCPGKPFECHAMPMVSAPTKAEATARWNVRQPESTSRRIPDGFRLAHVWQGSFRFDLHGETIRATHPALATREGSLVLVHDDLSVFTPGGRKLICRASLLRRVPADQSPLSSSDH